MIKQYHTGYREIAGDYKIHYKDITPDIKKIKK